MVREEVREMLPIIQAFAEGKPIEFRGINKWEPINNLSLTDNPKYYRIKPEPKYRPFKTQEECWNEMLKHQPFGFVVSKDSIDYSGICRVFKDEKGISRITFTSNPYSDWDMDIAFDRINFADGTPFGIREEQQ